MKKLFIFCILFVLILWSAYFLYAQSAENSIYVIPVKGVIDLGLSNFIKRSIQEAKTQKASLILLEIDTLGGRVDAALDIVSYLEETASIPTAAFIDNQAWSAGALISIACKDIYMSPGSSIGSAEPRVMGAEGKDEFRDEKMLSALRAKFKSLAEEFGHPVNLVVAMVDKDFEIRLASVKGEKKIITAQEFEDLQNQLGKKQIKNIKTINPKGKLLNLTANESKEYGLAKDIVKDRASLIALLGGEKKKIVEEKITWSENLVRFLTNPMISPLLLSLGILALIFEFKVPGGGLLGALGALLLILFFWGHYLVGLAQWTEILLFIAGIVIVALEIFIIPGFGVAGVVGFMLIMAGLFLSLIKNPLHIPRIELTQALYSMAYIVILISAGFFLLIRYLPHSKFFQKVVLHEKQKRYQSAPSLHAYIGKSGKTMSVLRPSGKVMIDGEPYDAITQGGFINIETKVKVIMVQGSSLVVEEDVSV